MRRRFRRLSTTVLTLAVTITVAAPATATAADLPVVYNSAAAVVTSLAHPGSAPPGANDWSCRSATHPRPVILLHGTHVNMAINWNTLSPY